MRNKFLLLLSVFFFSLFLALRGLYAESTDLEKRVEELESQIEAQSRDERTFDKFIQNFGGRIQFDITLKDEEDSSLRPLNNGSDLRDGSQFRRLYLNVSGQINPSVSYRAELDFAGSNVDFRNVYMEYKNLPIIENLVVGRYKEPITLDHSTSNLHLPFLSRSAVSNAFNNGWNNGLLWRKHLKNNKYNFSLGSYFSNDNNSSSPDSTSGKVNFTGRVTTPFIYLYEGRRVMHLGAGYSYRQPSSSSDPDADTFSSSVKPEVNNTNNFLNLRIPSVDHYQVRNVELAGVNGPFSYQAEYTNQVFSRPGQEPELEGFYVQGDFFLTGEIRPYDPASGSFKRVEPRRPFIGDHPREGKWGPGAWQVTLRYSNLDYTEAQNLTSLSSSQASESSELDILTAGLNWYMNSRSRWMLNVVDADQKSLGDARYLTTRFQVDF